MRIVKRLRQTITKKDFEELLGVPVHDLKYKDSYFQAIIKDEATRGEISVYLRCSDLKEAFGFPYNILDQDIEPVENGFSYYHQEEIIKTKFNLLKLRTKLKGLLE